MKNNYFSKSLLVTGFATLTSLLCTSSVQAAFEAPEPNTIKPAQDARPWDASIRIFYGRDDNVALVPDVTSYMGKKNSRSHGISFAGQYRLVQTPEMTAGFTANFDRVWYKEGMSAGDNDAPDQYDLEVSNPGVFIQRNLFVNGMPAMIGGSFDYRKERLEISNLASTNDRYTLYGALQPHQRVKLNASYSFSEYNSDTNFPSQALNNRDGDYKALSLSGTILSKTGKQKLIISYARTDNNSEGSNFDYDGYSYGLRFETHIHGPLWAAVGTTREDRDYKGFASGFIPAPGRKSQDITQNSVQLLWQICRQLTADIYYLDKDYDANQPEFEADRSLVGAGLTWTF